MLVAGFGNVFFSDDGFGPAVIRSLDGAEFPPGVVVRDFGTGGMHLALEMCAGYDAVVIVDAVSRADAPGTVYAIEAQEWCRRSVPDAHAMSVTAVLAVFDSMARQLECKRPRVIVAGCVPETTEEGMELSAVVRAAIPQCRKLLQTLTNDYVATGAKA